MSAELGRIRKQLRARASCFELLQYRELASKSLNSLSEAVGTVITTKRRLYLSTMYTRRERQVGTGHHMHHGVHQRTERLSEAHRNGVVLQ